MINHSPRVVQKETKEQKQQRHLGEKKRKEDRINQRALRKPEEKKRYIELVNIFSEFGIDYTLYGKKSYLRLQSQWDSALIGVGFTPRCWKFLHSNFHFVIAPDSFGQNRIYFTEPNTSLASEKHELFLPGKFAKNLIDKSGQPRSASLAVYEALLEMCKHSLKKKRRFHLPGLGRFSVRFCSAQGERQGRNPKTGEAVTLPPKAAHNRLHVSASKTLATWMEENIDVEFPKPKGSKKQKQQKRKRYKAPKSHFNDQILPPQGKTLADL